MIGKLEDTVHNNRKQSASSSKFWSSRPIDSPQYQKHLIKILFIIAVWLNQGLYVRHSPDYLKKTFGLPLKTMKIKHFSCCRER